jgi:ABC-type amino acid transport system permease subunit
MQKNKRIQGTFLRGIFSFILATIAGIATFVILIMIFFGLGLFGWSDGGEKEYLQRLEKSTNITLIISIIMAFIVFIAVFIRINRKTQMSDNDENS